MVKALQLVNGIPRQVDIAGGGGSLIIKDEGILIDGSVTEIDFTGSPITVTQTSAGVVEANVAGISVSEPTIYDETIEVSSTITTGTNVTLPSARTYTDDELEIYLEGQRLNVVDDYTLVGSPPRTDVQFNFDLVNGDTVRFRIDRDILAAPSIYDETLSVVASGAGVGQINEADSESGDPITLPSGKTYTDLELEVYLNGQRIEDVLDFNFVGSAPRTAISMTFNLVEGDVLRFRVDRAA